jgi:hypothetical protein
MGKNVHQPEFVNATKTEIGRINTNRYLSFFILEKLDLKLMKKINWFDFKNHCILDSHRLAVGALKLTLIHVLKDIFDKSLEIFVTFLL